MLCEYCEKIEMISGTLEGISFEPLSEHKKWLATGVYGVKASVCPKCGRLSNLSIDIDSLKKITKI
jgi:hypothetical protein